MSAYTIVTAEERERFDELQTAMKRADGPKFLEYDHRVAQYWQLLAETFPQYQFGLVEKQSGQTVGIGRSIPFAYHGSWDDLPAEGLDWVLEQGFRDHTENRISNLMSALYIEIADGHRNKNLSAQMLDVMRQIARSMGFRNLVAPIRPSHKSHYPLTPIDEYMRWQNDKGLPFDPWLRVHVRAGGQILHSCPRAMLIRGSRQEWTTWTGIEFKSDGDYIIPYGLVPLSVCGNTCEYIEPGIWILHNLQEKE